MRLPKFRILLGTASLAALVALFFLIAFFSFSKVSGRIPVEKLNVIKILSGALAVFVWIGIGRTLGAAVSVVFLGFTVFLYMKTANPADVFYIAASAVSLSLGYGFFRNLSALKHNHRIESEKKEEVINVLKNDLNQSAYDIVHLENRLERFISLSVITEKFSSTLNEEEIEKIIVNSSYEIFKKSDRVLLYRVDPERQEIMLVYSKKVSDLPYIRQKKGDLFDRWVFWKKQPLLVEDTQKDFRFAAGLDIIDAGLRSIISVPLMSGEKVLGMLRMDSSHTAHYTQEDIRFLDMIGGLASVALDNAMLYKRLIDLAITDSLTGTYVHKYFIEKIENEITRAAKTNGYFSVVIMDIDYFKEYNDKYGHIAGDIVLRHIASLLKKLSSGGDIVARYGGEEFAVLLLNKDMKQAEEFCETIRKTVEKSPIILRRQETFVTVSIGISVYKADGEHVDDLVRVADRRLYKAKSKGKNRVCSV